MAWQTFLGQFGSESIKEPAEKAGRWGGNFSGPELSRALFQLQLKCGDGMMSERLTTCHETDTRRCKNETSLQLRQGYDAVITGG